MNWQDLPLSLVKVEVVDLESEASTAGTPRGQLAQRQDSFSSLSPVGRQDSLDSLDSQDSKTGLKRKASFQTPSPKKRLFEEGSQAVQARQIEQLKKTMEKDSPTYYRLDYLWGKTPEREAQPGLKPDTATERQQKQQEQNRQSLEARASQAVEELGLQPVVKVVRQKKAGRPPGSQNKVKPVPTLRKRRADVPAKAKLGMMAELDRLAIEKASKRQARLQLMKQYGVSETFCWNLQRSAKRQKVSNFVAKAATGSTGVRQPGSHLALVHMVSQSAGKRVPDEGKALGRPDHLKSVWQETRAWALTEEARQHILTAGDVLLDFEDRLEAAIALRQAEETAGTLDKTGQAELAAMRQKRDTLTKNKRQRDKYQVKLLAKCGLRTRACQQTANLPPEEEKARLETAWRLWDSLLQQAASSQPDKSFPVSDIEEWARHRRETAITMSDQIPAWLKPSPGKVVTSVLRLKLAKKQSKHRAAARKKGSTILHEGFRTGDEPLHVKHMPAAAVKGEELPSPWAASAAGMPLPPFTLAFVKGFLRASTGLALLHLFYETGARTS